MDISVYPFPEAALQVLQLTFENVGATITVTVEKQANGGAALLGPISSSFGGEAGAAEGARGAGRSRRASPV